MNAPSTPVPNIHLRLLRTCVGIGAFLILAASPLQAQTSRQIGAWDALMLTPVGALTPTTHDPGDVPAGAQEIALRYGRWRYDADDAIHDNAGVTWSRRLGFAHATVAATVGYSLTECRGCNGWINLGVDLRSEPLHRDVGTAFDRPITVGLGLRGTIGEAVFRGPGSVTATSLALLVPFDASVPITRSSRLITTMVAGLGYGRIVSTRVAEAAVLPVIGGSVGWTITSQLAINLGWQQVLLVNTPSQFGLAISWGFLSHAGIRKE